MPKKFSYDAKYEPYVAHLRHQDKAERTIQQYVSSIQLFEQSGCKTTFDFQAWYRLNFPESTEKTLAQHINTINRYLNWLSKPNAGNEQLLIKDLADSEDNIEDNNIRENNITDNIISENITKKNIIRENIISENNTKKQSFNCRRDNYLRLQTLSAFKGVSMSDLINKSIEKFLLEYASELQQAKKML